MCYKNNKAFHFQKVLTYKRETVHFLKEYRNLKNGGGSLIHVVTHKAHENIELMHRVTEPS